MSQHTPTPAEYIVFNPDCAVFTVALDGVIAKVTIPTKRIEYLIRDTWILRFAGFAGVPRSRDEALDFLRSVARDVDARLTLCELEDAEIIVSANAAPHRDMWHRYGWGEARHSFLASCNIGFADDGDQDHAIRRRILVEYGEAGAPSLISPRVAAEPPPEEVKSGPPLIQLLASRKTTRVFDGTPIDRAILHAILRLAFTERRELALKVAHGPVDPITRLRSRFIAFDVFVVAQRVTDLRPGIYEYDVEQDHLALVTHLASAADADHQLRTLVWGQTMPALGSFAFLITIDFSKYMQIYRHERAYRNLLISLGEFAQLLLLTGQAVGLKSCMTPAIRDSFADHLCNIESKARQTFYYLGFGH